MAESKIRFPEAVTLRWYLDAVIDDGFVHDKPPWQEEWDRVHRILARSHTDEALTAYGENRCDWAARVVTAITQGAPPTYIGIGETTERWQENQGLPGVRRPLDSE